MPRSPLDVLALIPARGGSKGIPRKNLIEFCGQPLIQHTLQAARRSRFVTQTLVTTDDAEIAEFCAQVGFPTPYRRPWELAQDTSPMIDVVLDALEWYEARESSPDYVLLLQPTSPLRDADDIDGLLSWLQENGAPSAASVHALREHPMESVVVSDSGRWSYLVDPPEAAYGRQVYEDNFYFINGAMYAVTPSFVREHRRFVDRDCGTVLYVMQRDHGLDIDLPEDLEGWAGVSSPSRG